MVGEDDVVTMSRRLRGVGMSGVLAAPGSSEPPTWSATTANPNHVDRISFADLTTLLRTA